MATHWSGSTRQSLSLCAASSPSDEEMGKLMSLTNCFLHELVELVYQYRVNEEVFDSKVLTEKRRHWGLIVSEVSPILSKHLSPFTDRVNTQLTCLDQAIAEVHWDDVKILFECKCLQAMVRALLDTWRPGWDTSDRVLAYSDADDAIGFDCMDYIKKDSLYHDGNINVSINFSSHSRVQYAHLLKTKDNFDVTFLVGDETIKAHRIILAVQSEYFDRLLYGEMSEGVSSSAGSAPIVLKDVRVSSFQLLMCFAYTGYIELKSAHLEGLLELLEVADRFCFVKLKDALSKKLTLVINVTSVLPIFVTADHLGLHELCRTCLRYADRHADKVLNEDTILSLPQDNLISLLSRDSFAADELSIYKCVKSWMAHNSISSCDPLLQCVRLSEIPASELLDLASPHGQFTEGQVIVALRVQMKGLLGEGRPRGCCEFGKNLFDHKDTSKLKDQVSWKLFNDTLQGPPMSLSHSSTSLFRTGGGGSRHRPMARRSQPPIQQMGGGRLLTYFGLPEDPLSNVIIFNDSMSLQPVFIASTFSSSSSSSSSNTFSSLAFIVILNDVYLINHLSFDLLDSDVHGALSYAVEISKGGETQSDWLRLMDYSQYSCYGRQELRFPKQAIKCIRFYLRSGSHSQIAVRLLCCSLEETHTVPTKYCKNGVLGPLSYVSPVALETAKSDEEMIWNFKTPLVITTAKFVVERVLVSCAVYTTQHSVLVKWGATETTLKQKTVNIIMEHNNQEVIFELDEEEVVTIIIVALIKSVDIEAVTIKNLVVLNKLGNTL